jgi:hypothetical protein
MAMNAASNLAEKVLGSGDSSDITTGVSNPSVDISKFADTNVKMHALTWMGKNDVQISIFPYSHPQTLSLTIVSRNI